MSLKIVVLAKQVPDTRNVGKDAMKADGTINRAALPAIFNPEDLNALEQALRLKDEHPGSTVTILTMGRDVAFMAMHNGPVSNAFIVNDLRILSWTAERFGRTADAERYRVQLEKTREAYLTAFVKDDGTMSDDYQGAYIMALRFVIPKGALWDRVFAKLVEKIRAEGMQTGFFSTEHLLPLLADNGEAKLAFDLLFQEECPGWMYQVKRGGHHYLGALGCPAARWHGE